MQRFGVPGKTLAGSDSHTCAAGSLGMLALGTGGLEAALAMAGRSLHVTMPGSGESRGARLETRQQRRRFAWPVLVWRSCGSTSAVSCSGSAGSAAPARSSTG
ncbi:aconitase family protein [Streptomyces sp. OE57]|uniref:aconitase family protein n=1 Tax=Streptomyces lacaronensis TaxID=3379885 RepID=UPI0039B73703